MWFWKSIFCLVTLSSPAGSHFKTITKHFRLEKNELEVEEKQFETIVKLSETLLNIMICEKNRLESKKNYRRPSRPSGDPSDATVVPPKINFNFRNLLGFFSNQKHFVSSKSDIWPFQRWRKLFWAIKRPKMFTKMEESLQKSNRRSWSALWNGRFSSRICSSLNSLKNKLRVFKML